MIIYMFIHTHTRFTNNALHCSHSILTIIYTKHQTHKFIKPQLDMFSGYHQLALRDDVKRWCCFHWEGNTYQWQVLPFGLNIAPRTYQKCLLKLFTKWRAQGYRCCSYIDDGLWAASSLEDALKLREVVLKDLATFGLIVNQAKAQVEPSQAVRFLGHIVDTSSSEVRLFVPDDKVTKIVADVCKVLDAEVDGSIKVSGHQLASVLGKVLATQYAYAPARLMTRELFAALRQLPYREMRSSKGVESEHWIRVRDYSKPVTLGEAAILELRFLAKMPHWNGATWCEATPTRTLYTDGSKWGFGALLRRVRDGVEGDVMAWTQGEHDLSESERDSTRTELVAILEALASMEDDVRGETVLHRTDNVALYFALANGGYTVGENSDLNLMIRKVWALSSLLGVRLQTEYVGSAGIIRSGADLLSREDFDREDRSLLKSEAYEHACRMLQTYPDKDLFAEPGRNQDRLPYYSRNPEHVDVEEGCLGYDALTQPWRGTCWAYPPGPLVDVAVLKALREVDRHGSKIIIVVPHWPGRPWFPLLNPFRFVELGTLEKVTTLPPGRGRPIELKETWKSTVLRAYLIEKK